MRTVLCYGDSNTWGYIPVTGERFARDVRWTGVLQGELGSGYHVIEEGLSGRTTIWDDPYYPYLNGRSYFLPCLLSHQPLDLVVILLGTNDLWPLFGRSAPQIAKAAGTLVEVARQYADHVLLMAPPPVGPFPDDDEMHEGASEKSRKLGVYYRLVAEQNGCEFLDAAEHVASSPADGVHWEADAHARLGRAVAESVVQILR